MGIGLANYVYWSTGRVTYVSKVAKAFIDRVVADGGTVESKACLISALTYLNPVEPVPLSGYLLTDYSGAAAAYSLRLLRDIYVGSAIRVRRASDNTEQNIGFVNNELDTTSLETFCSGTDGFVSTWYDQSGNANNAFNVTANQQPKIVSSGSTILDNGKPIMIGLNSNTKFNINAALSPAQDVTSFFTGKNGGSLRGIALNFKSGASTRYLYAAESGSTSDATSLGTIVNRLNGSTFVLTNRDAMHSATTNQSLLSAAISETKNLDELTKIGWTSNWSMWDTQELIVYNSDKSSDFSGIETNINTHYSIY